MLGGYYLGQLYLGISGLPVGGTLSLQGASHQLSSDNITLTQKHTIVVDNTTHSLSSGNLDLVEHKTLAVDNTQHGHTVDSVTISVRSYLDVSNGIHGLSSDNTVLTQKHTLAINNTAHALISDALGGLINLQPDGFGGGFGAIDGWGVRQYGEINIELPNNYLILNLDSYISLVDDFSSFTQKHSLDVNDGHINMTFRNLELWQVLFRHSGIYIKDFQESGALGAADESDSGTIPVKKGDIGELTSVAETNQGIFVPKMGSSGSYEENDVISGIIVIGNRGSGSYAPVVKDTGTYIKNENNQGEYEVQ